jgi:hypothetical protein
MKIITKKIDTEWFNAIEAGTKNYELRLADFDVSVGDLLCLEEWVGEGDNRHKTGRVIEKILTHVRKVDLDEWLKKQPELVQKGFYVLQF